ncbi:MAG: ABC transporter permease subunit [Alphaproteobacteria bacterium]
MGLVETFLRRTRTGLELRAVADSASLAATVGLNIPRIEAMAGVLAGACAGLASLVVAADQDIRFSMGTNLLLGAALCAFVGGGARPISVALVGFGIGALDTAAVWFIPSGWEDFILGVALLGVLIASPESVGRLLQQSVRWV